MCTYNITLDDKLVSEAENLLMAEIPFQLWLQQQVESMLRTYVEKPRRILHRHHRGLSDEDLDKELSQYPPLADKDFPDIDIEAYAHHIKAVSGRLPKGLEKRL